MSTFTEGTVHQVTNAFEAAGFISADLTALRSDVPRLQRLRMAVRGYGEIVINEDKDIIHRINCDAPPIPPVPTWKLEQHIMNGPFLWDPRQVEKYLYVCPEIMLGAEFFKALKYMSVLNANVLDYLLVHSYLIPESWDHVFFFGTTWTDERERVYVGYLCRRGNCWVKDYELVDVKFHYSGLAAIRASS